jgi:uncharacterized membrane protein YqjE
MLERIGKVGAGLVALAGLRVELFGVELSELLESWVRVAVLAMAAVVLFCIGLGFTAVLVTMMFWPGNAIIALSVFAASFLAGALFCARALAGAAAAARDAFPATVAEFRRDREALARAETERSAP